MCSIETLEKELEENHPQLGLNILMIKQQLMFILQATSPSLTAQTTPAFLTCPVIHTSTSSSVVNTNSSISSSPAVDAASAFPSSPDFYTTSSISTNPAVDAAPASPSNPDFYTTSSISTNPAVDAAPASTMPGSSNGTMKSILKLPDPFVRSGVHRKYKKKNHGGMTSDFIMAQYNKVENEKLTAQSEREEKKRKKEELKTINEKIKNMKKEKKSQEVSASKIPSKKRTASNDIVRENSEDKARLRKKTKTYENNF